MNTQVDLRPADASQEWVELAAPILIVVLGALAYANSFWGVFIFDDTVAISSNPAVTRFMSPQEMIDEPKLGKTRPLVLFTFQLNYALGGYEVWGYHLANLLIHLTAGLFLYGIVRRSLGGQRLAASYGQSATVLAAICAAVWVVHPLQTQSVTYIVQRCESLCGMFYLFTLYAVIRGGLCEEQGGGAQKTAWYVTAVVACAAGMTSKAVMVTAPVIILAYDRIFISRDFAEIVRRRWALYCGLASTWIILFWLRGRVPPRDLDTASHFYEDATPLEYLATQAGVLVHYLGLSFWPHPLCLDYTWPKATSLFDTWLSGIFILLLLLTTVVLLWRCPTAGFLGVWFFGILAPTSSIVPIYDLAVEHRMYLPLAAVVVAVVIGSFNLIRWIPVPSNLQQALGVGTAAVVIVALAVGTFMRNADYHSRLVLWSSVTEVVPNNARAHFNVGLSLVAEERYEEAIESLERAVEIMPDFDFVLLQLGIVHLNQRNPAEAERWLNKAQAIRPRLRSLNYLLALASQQQGKIPAAIRYYQKSIEMEPALYEAYANLGMIYASENQFEETVELFEKAAALRPESDEARAALAWAQQELSKRKSSPAANPG